MALAQQTDHRLLKGFTLAEDHFLNIGDDSL
jgi:hypothetical protein